MTQSDSPALSPAEALAALQWLAEAGVDDTVEENASDWFAAASLPPPALKSVAPAAAPVSAAIMPSVPSAQPAPVYASQSHANILAAARDAADKANTLEDLRAAVQAFEGCALKKLATHTVFADGNPQSDLMLIGEAPGADEDREGIPFCGVSGQLLDRMFAAIGRSRHGENGANFYITNTIFWRPPGNRNPTAEELAICRPFVEKHIALVKPKHLILVGGIAAHSLLEVTTGITRLRGQKHQYQNGYMPDPVPASALFHPSYLLRQPSHKALAWQDLLGIQARLGA